MAKNSSLSKREVEQLLLDAFNAPQDSNDEAKLAVYKEIDSASIHPILGKSFAQLIEDAALLSHFTAKNLEFDTSTIPNQIQFDFKRFCNWLAKIRSPDYGSIPYKPLNDEQLNVSREFLENIPHENRLNMSFSNFTVSTPLQNEMRSISEKFCRDVMLTKSVCVVLTGNAGIGKTASAVSCAKELSSRGKKVVWIAEVTVTGWNDQAVTMEELEICDNKIQKLLDSKPDAVFLDDDNLVGYSGRILLEKIYKWFVTTPNVGLFITSNESITFEKCYGYKLDKKYHFPPFPGYCSSQYQNTIWRQDMSGQSMRLRPSLQIMELSEREKITALINYAKKPSIGIIIGPENYDLEKHNFFPDAELVPAFPRETFLLITQSLRNNGALGPIFDQLTPEQKSYTKRFPVNKREWINGLAIDIGIHWYDGINVKAFEKTSKTTIIVELLAYYQVLDKKMLLEENCLAQLLRVVNYAHDCGGKKIILLNKTEFSHAELLDKIKESLRSKEKERTLARINALLFSPELEMAIHQKENHLASKIQKIGYQSDPKVPKNLNSPIELFFSCGNPINKLEQNSLIENRHQSPKSQRDYDRRFGLALSPTANKLEQDSLIENRHQSPKSQRDYDRKFGLALSPAVINKKVGKKTIAENPVNHSNQSNQVGNVLALIEHKITKMQKKISGSKWNPFLDCNNIRLLKEQLLEQLKKELNDKSKSAKSEQQNFSEFIEAWLDKKEIPFTDDVSNKETVLSNRVILSIHRNTFFGSTHEKNTATLEFLYNLKHEYGHLKF